MGIFSKKKTNAPAAKEKKEEKAVVVAAPAKDVQDQMSLRVILRPLVTEKTATLQSANKYTFVVAAWATKQHIAKAIKDMYGVDAKKVHVVNVEGRRVRFGQNQGRQSDSKKALVTLAKGQTITVHEGV